jgi:hypothetical protein
VRSVRFIGAALVAGVLALAASCGGPPTTAPVADAAYVTIVHLYGSDVHRIAQSLAQCRTEPACHSSVIEARVTANFLGWRLTGLTGVVAAAGPLRRDAQNLEVYAGGGHDLADVKVAAATLADALPPWAVQ